MAETKEEIEQLERERKMGLRRMPTAVPVRPSPEVVATPPGPDITSVAAPPSLPVAQGLRRQLKVSDIAELPEIPGAIAMPTGLPTDLTQPIVPLPEREPFPEEPPPVPEVAQVLPPEAAPFIAPEEEPRVPTFAEVEMGAAPDFLPFKEMPAGPTIGPPGIATELSILEKMEEEERIREWQDWISRGAKPGFRKALIRTQSLLPGKIGVAMMQLVAPDSELAKDMKAFVALQERGALEPETFIGKSADFMADLGTRMPLFMLGGIVGVNPVYLFGGLDAFEQSLDMASGLEDHFDVGQLAVSMITGKFLSSKLPKPIADKLPDPLLQPTGLKRIGAALQELGVKAGAATALSTLYEGGMGLAKGDDEAFIKAVDNFPKQFLTMFGLMTVFRARELARLGLSGRTANLLQQGGLDPRQAAQEANRLTRPDTQRLPSGWRIVEAPTTARGQRVVGFQVRNARGQTVGPVHGTPDAAFRSVQNAMDAELVDTIRRTWTKKGASAIRDLGRKIAAQSRRGNPADIPGRPRLSAGLQPRPGAQPRPPQPDKPAVVETPVAGGRLMSVEPKPPAQVSPAAIPMKTADGEVAGSVELRPGDNIVMSDARTGEEVRGVAATDNPVVIGGDGSAAMVTMDTDLGRETIPLVAPDGSPQWNVHEVQRPETVTEPRPATEAEATAVREQQALREQQGDDFDVNEASSALLHELPLPDAAVIELATRLGVDPVDIPQVIADIDAGATVYSALRDGLIAGGAEDSIALTGERDAEIVNQFALDLAEGRLDDVIAAGRPAEEVPRGPGVPAEPEVVEPVAPTPAEPVEAPVPRAPEEARPRVDEARREERRGRISEARTEREGRLGDIQRQAGEGAFGDEARTAFAGAEYDSDFARTEEFVDIDTVAERNGLNAVPTKNLPVPAMIVGDTVLIDSKTAADLPERTIAATPGMFAVHEDFHREIDLNNPDAGALVELVDRTSEEFRAFSEAYNAALTAKGIDPVTDETALAEELAAQWFAGIETARGVSISGAITDIDAARELAERITTAAAERVEEVEEPPAPAVPVPPPVVEAAPRFAVAVEIPTQPTRPELPTDNIDWERVEELGTTDDLREAGYIAPTGALVDLSGKREGGEPGTRSYDHREAGGTQGMQELMAQGFIRSSFFGAELSLDIAAPVTPDQKSSLRQAIEEANGEVVLDLEDGLGEESISGTFYAPADRVFRQEYPEGTRPELILNNIDQFFAGEEPIVPTTVRFAAPTEEVDEPIRPPPPAIRQAVTEAEPPEQRVEELEPRVTRPLTPAQRERRAVQFERAAAREEGRLGAERVAARAIRVAKERRDKIIGDLRDRTQGVQDSIKEVVAYARRTLPKGERDRVLAKINEIAGRARPETRDRVVAETKAMLDDLYERYRKRLYGRDIARLLKRTRPKKVKGIPRGAFDPETQKSFDAIDAAYQMSHTEADEAMQNIIDAVEGRTNPEFTDDEMDQVVALTMYGGLESRSGDDAEKAWQYLDDAVKTGRTKHRILREAETAERAELRAETADTLRGGAEPLTQAEELARRPTTLTGRAWKKFTEGLNAIDDKLQSFEWLLDKLSKFEKRSRILRSTPVERFGRTAHRATHAESTGIRRKMKELNDKLQDVFQATGAKLERKLGEISEPVKETGVHLYELTDKQAYDQAFLELRQAQEMVKRHADSPALLERAQAQMGAAAAEMLRAGERVQGDQLAISQGEGYKIWQMWQDPTLREDLERQGVTEETIAELDNYLSPEVKEWARWQIEEFYPQYYEEINPVFRRMFYVDMPRNEFYTPIRRRIDTKADEDPLLRQRTVHSSVLARGLRSRVKNQRELEFVDGDSMLVRHIMEMERFKAWAEPMREMRSVLGSEEVKTAIRQFHGQNANIVLGGFLDDMARGGAHRQMIQRGIDKWKSNYSKGVISLNLPLLPKQLSSIPAYAAEIPVKDFITGVASALRHPVIAAKTLFEKSEAMRSRYDEGNTIETMIALQRSAAQMMAGTKRVFAFARLPAQIGDAAAIVIGGWGVYQHHLKNNLEAGMPQEQAEKAAIEEFERTTERSQQAGQVKDLSYYQRMGSLGSIWTMFKTSPLSYFRMLDGAIRNAVKGRASPAQAAKLITIAGILLPILFEWVSQGFRLTKKGLMKALTSGNLQGIPFLGDLADIVAESAMNRSAWGQHGGPPITSSFDRAGQVAAKVARFADNPDEISQKDILQVADAMAYLLSVGPFKATGGGLPYTGAKRIATGVKDVATGQTENPWLRLMGFSQWTLDQRKEREEKAQTDPSKVVTPFSGTAGGITTPFTQ